MKKCASCDEHMDVGHSAERTHCNDCDICGGSGKVEDPGDAIDAAMMNHELAEDAKADNPHRGER